MDYLHPLAQYNDQRLRNTALELSRRSEQQKELYRQSLALNDLNSTHVSLQLRLYDRENMVLRDIMDVYAQKLVHGVGEHQQREFAKSFLRELR